MLHIDFSAIQIDWSYMQNNSGNKNKEFRTMQSQHRWKEADLEM